MGADAPLYRSFETYRGVAYPWQCNGTLVRLGGKSVEYRHELRGAGSRDLHSTSEQVTVLFDLARRRAAPLGEAMRQRAEGMRRAD